MALELSYAGSGVIAINTILVAPTEVGKREGFSLHISSIGTTGAIVVEGSNDNVNWVALRSVSAASGVATASITGAGLYVGACTARYVRVRLSVATTAGNTALTCRFTDSVQNDVVPSPAITSGSAVIGLVYPTVSGAAANGPTLLFWRLLSAAATTNAASIKGGVGRVLKVRGYNAAAALRYLKLYNKATAPTVGTDVPVLTFALKASDSFDIDLSQYGALFSTGIGIAFTTGVADADTGALTAGDVLGFNMIYI